MGAASDKDEVIFEIVQDKCIACGNCREVCPLDAVIHTWTFDARYRTTIKILGDACVGCGGPAKAPCVRFCPVPDCIVPVPMPAANRARLHAHAAAD